MIDEIGNQSAVWSQYGLSGLVIFALFICMAFIVWLSMKSATLQTAAFVAEVNDSKIRHHEERKEWRESNERTADKLQEAIKELTNSLRQK